MRRQIQFKLVIIFLFSSIFEQLFAAWAAAAFDRATYAAWAVHQAPSLTTRKNRSHPHPPPHEDHRPPPHSRRTSKWCGSKATRQTRTCASSRALMKLSTKRSRWRGALARRDVRRSDGRGCSGCSAPSSLESSHTLRRCAFCVERWCGTLRNSLRSSGSMPAQTARLRSSKSRGISPSLQQCS